MRTDPVDLGIYLLFTIAGFLIKFGFDRYAKYKDAVRLESWRLQIDGLEKKLSQFYWPIYCRLKRGSIAWKSRNFRDFGEDDVEARERFALTFDEQVIMQNHLETRDIIQQYFHHFGGDKALETALIELLHHIDIYLALRESGSENDPVWMGQPWPENAEKLIEQKLHLLQKDYDDLLAKTGGTSIAEPPAAIHATGA